MAHIIDGMRYCYDYEDLLEELQGDIEEGLIDEYDELYIVREKESLKEGGIDLLYKPICDYYKMDALEMLEHEIAEAEFCGEEPDPEIYEEIDQYHEDEPFFEKNFAKFVIEEMEHWNSIF